MFFKLSILSLLLIILGSCGKPKRQAFIRGVNSLESNSTKFSLLYHTSSYSNYAVINGRQTNTVSIPETGANHQFTIIDSQTYLYGRKGQNRYYVLNEQQEVIKNSLLPISNLQRLKKIDGEFYFWDRESCKVNRGSSLENFLSISLDASLCTSQNPNAAKVQDVQKIQDSLLMLTDSGLVSLSTQDFLFKFPNGLNNPFGGMVAIDNKEFLIAFTGLYSQGQENKGKGLGYFSETGTLLSFLEFNRPPTALKKISDSRFLLSTGFDLFMIEIKNGKLGKDLLVSNQFYAIDAIDTKDNALIWAEARKSDRAFGYEIKKMNLSNSEVEVLAELNENVMIDKLQIMK